MAVRPAARAARRVNSQLRRLRAGLEAARETMAIHFGEDDEAVKAADRALRGDAAPLELEPLTPRTVAAMHKIRRDMARGIAQ